LIEADGPAILSRKSIALGPFDRSFGYCLFRLESP
jgi:hypothetical protein